MRPLLLAVLLWAAPAQAAPDEVTVKELKNLSPERCLQLPPAELATRCPTIAGRFITVDQNRIALLDRVDQRKGSYVCDESSGSWRCRKLVVIDRELRGARKRNSQAFAIAADLLRQIATSSSVRLGEEFGALFAPGLQPRTCLTDPQRGCAVQAIRLRGRATDKNGTPMVRRRLWLVEDADGTLLQCSDAQLARCDELAAAGWLALTVTLRPSAMAPPEPPPEIEVPEVRTDKRTGSVVLGGADTADTPAGALDPYFRPKSEHALPRAPSKADVSRTAHTLELRGRACLSEEKSATVEVIFSGEGNLVSLVVDGAGADDPETTCLSALAHKLEFPRFAGNTYHLRAVVLPTPVRARAPHR